MQETEMLGQHPAALRYEEANYFLSQFIKNCGPPSDSYFLMICYFDAFLFVFVSIEEMVSKDIKIKLQEQEVFRFLKALRNINSHHSILAAPLSDNKFPRPFSRIIVDEPANSSAHLRLNYDMLRDVFDSVEQKRPKEKSTLDFARQYLVKLENMGKTNVYLDDVLKEGLEQVRALLFAMPHR